MLANHLYSNMEQKKTVELAALLDYGKFSDVYELTEFIEEGGSGAVFYARFRGSEDEKFIVKKSKKLRRRIFSEKLGKTVSAEAYFLSTLEHENLPTLVDFFEEAACVFMVMPWDGVVERDLLQFMNRIQSHLTEYQSARICIQLVSALRYLHGKKIAHRDVKPENILVNANGHVKLIDFGLAVKTDEDMRGRTTVYGTARFTSPEIHRKDPYDQLMYVHGDVWALGCSLYCMLCWALPFETEEDALCGRYTTDAVISTGAYKLLDRFFEVDREKRIKLDEVEDDLWLIDASTPI